MIFLNRKLVGAFLVMLIAVLLGLAGCGGEGETPSSLPATATFTKTPTSFTSTSTKEQTATITSTVTKTPRPTRIPTKVLTNLLFTPLPTIPPEERVAALKYLINEDPGCLLPCWMGVTPGETTLHEAWQQLAPYATDLYIRNNSLSMWFEFELEKKTELVPAYQMTAEMVNQFEFDNGLITFIHPEIYGAKERYPLRYVLDTYGVPDEVRTAVGALADFYANLNLHYTDLGVHFLYQSVIYSEDLPEGDMLKFCFQEIRRVWAWDPALGLTYTDPENKLPSSRSLTLEEATGLSIEEFYAAAQNRDQVCLESSKEMWLRFMGVP